MYSFLVRLLSGSYSSSIYPICTIAPLVRKKLTRTTHVLLMFGYTHSLTSSISDWRFAGYKSTFAFSAGSRSLKAVLKMRMISALSLFTMVCFFLSHNTGTLGLWGQYMNRSRINGVMQIIKWNIPSVVIGIGSEIEVYDVFRIIQRIDLCTREWIDGCERPAMDAQQRGYNCHRFKYLSGNFRRFDQWR